jgi:gamma-glutamyl hercynylcysteine S-oxide hydrolase
MCRHLAYLGPPLPLAALLLDPPHSLVQQSFAPRDMRGGGRINADGFGVGWYPIGALAAVRGVDEPGMPTTPPIEPEPSTVPLRYRSVRPIWTDTFLPQMAAATSAGAVLAAVRNATVGMPVLETGAAPFTEGRWLFSHNGAIEGWPDSVTGLASTLPARDLLTLDAPTDAALLWALVRHELRRGADLTKSIVDTVRTVAEAAPGSRLNLLLTDGRAAVATTWWHALSVRRTDDATLISSEPLDEDPAWRAVPDRHLVVATAGTVEITPLP